jgi:hypothetical protein
MSGLLNLLIRCKSGSRSACAETAPDFAALWITLSRNDMLEPGVAEKGSSPAARTE